MSAKTELFDRLTYLDAAVKGSYLIDIGIQQSEHNGSANLLRKGLSIVAFNILEDFIKNKAKETLTHVSNSDIIFSNLSESLQKDSILGALNSLAFRARIIKKDGGDWQSLIQSESLKIHSTKNDNFQLSEFSLVSSGSNIAAEEVTSLLRAFSIDGGWNKLKSVSDKINGGVTDLNQAYKNATERRHNSAHAAEFRYEHSWLSGIKREILSIAASLDILLTARCRQIDSDTTKNITEHDIENALNFRYLEKHDQVYKDTSIIGSRSRKNWVSLESAVANIKPKLVNDNNFLIVLDSTGSLNDWHV